MSEYQPFNFLINESFNSISVEQLMIYACFQTRMQVLNILKATPKLAFRDEPKCEMKVPSGNSCRIMSMRALPIFRLFRINSIMKHAPFISDVQHHYWKTVRNIHTP